MRYTSRDTIIIPLSETTDCSILFHFDQSLVIVDAGGVVFLGKSDKTHRFNEMVFIE